MSLRWFGVYAPTPMRVLVDTVGEILAEYQIADWDDYDNLPEALLPIVAYANDAIAFDSSGTVEQKRAALRRNDELQAAIGTEDGFQILMSINQSEGTIRYQPAVMVDGQGPFLRDIELDIALPPGRVGDTGLAQYLVRASRRTLPYTLNIQRINILSSYRATFYMGVHVAPVHSVQYVRPINIAAALTAPSFADDTGDAQTWTQNAAIGSITVPAASGDPSPAYAVFGVLPAGIAFNTATRVISGTPTAIGSGTITIRATNSEGNDDWSVAYTTVVALTAPTFADDTGDAQNWTQNQAIAPITVPAATGNPAPTYAVVGMLPAGISFNTSSRVLSGAPTAAGSGTIRIRASNSEGGDDWTVAFTTSAALTAPSFADDTGDAQTWTQNAAIGSITVPEASGTPAPTYAASGLPSGISFNTSSRVLSGAPTAAGSGTITITATNSEGSDTWTVAYTTNASVTVNLTGYLGQTDRILWVDGVSLGSTFDANGQAQTLDFAALNDVSPQGQVELSLHGSNEEFTPEFEATGRIIFTASDGETLEVMIANADMSEPYVWIPTNSAEVIAFASHVRGLADQNATLTLTEA